MIAAAMLAVAAGGGGLIMINEADRRSELNGSAAVDRSVQVGAPFALTDQNGIRRTSAEFRGRRMLLVFARLADRDRTLAGLQVIDAALKMLEAQVRTLAPIFVTTDPEGDTPTALRLVLDSLDAGWTGLVSPAADVHALVNAYRIPVPKRAPGIKGDPPIAAVIACLTDESGNFLSHRTVPSDPALFAAWLLQNR